MAADDFQVSLKKVMDCNSEWEGKYGRDLATLAVGQPSADGGRFLPTARQHSGHLPTVYVVRAPPASLNILI